MQSKSFNPKKIKCKIINCTNRFIQKNSFHVACCPDHAILIGFLQKKKNELKKDNEKRELLKTRPQHLKEAQAIFNSYIRERDKDLPCISCGRTTGSWDAGHYRSIGSCQELRFDELNVHKQDVFCNQFNSGNLINYRLGLIKKIGLEKVEWLESFHQPKKYTIEEIVEIKRIYKIKLKELKNKIEEK